MAVPLRELTKKNIAWQWLLEQQAAFQQVKEILCSDVIVRPFNPRMPTSVLTDASKLHGLGFALVQSDDTGWVYLIACGSKPLTPTQQRYAVIELEGLAIKWAIKQNNYYLRGMPHFDVITDHKPLRGIFAKPLHEITNPRLLRYREALNPYSFEVSWNAGKNHIIADALSLAPVLEALMRTKTSLPFSDSL